MHGQNNNAHLRHKHRTVQLHYYVAIPVFVLRLTDKKNAEKHKAGKKLPALCFNKMGAGCY